MQTIIESLDDIARDNVYTVTPHTDNLPRIKSSYDPKENQRVKWFQQQPTHEVNLLSTCLVHFSTFKKEVNEKCKIDYPVTTPDKKKRPGGRYSTKKMRDTLGKLLFGVNTLSDDRWSLIRMFSRSIRETPNGAAFKKLIDKSKVFDDVAFEYTLAVAVYMKLKHPTKFPLSNQRTFDRLKSWISNDYGYVNVLEVSFPTYSVSRYASEIEVYCPWFSHKTVDNPELKKTLISYGYLQELLKKTFYGYCPTPQWLGQLGYEKPKSREYSLQDYYRIRLEIIESKRRRKKPDNHIIFEEW